MKLETTFHGTCKVCGAECVEKDPEKRDWQIIKHYQAANHKHFRRWTRDGMGDITQS